jgi:putative heme iron utilization protein
VAAAEAEIISHVNQDHPDAIAAIATGLLGGTPGPWRMVAVDPDGCDISDGEASRRLAFPAPVGDAEGVRMALISAARDGRAALATP